MSTGFSQREKVIIIVCLITVAVYLGYTFYYLPLEDKQIRLHSEVVSLERELKRNMELLKQGESLGQQDNPVLKEFRQRGPEEEVMAEILSQIEGVAGRFTFQINQLKPKRVRQAEVYNHFAVSLTINGELQEILQFLYILQREPFYFNVDEALFDKRLPNSPVVQTQLILGKSLLP